MVDIVLYVIEREKFSIIKMRQKHYIAVIVKQKCGLCYIKKCISRNLKNPIYNYPSGTKLLYYNDCKTRGMVNIIDKECSICSLEMPSHNYPN